MSRSAERIVSLLWLLLEAGANGRTKSEIFSYLYDHLDTSQTAKQRQFSRDKAALTSIGVPVQWQQQAHAEDVYLIDRDQLYLPDLTLRDDEIVALHQARALWMRTPIEDAIHAALARMTAQQPTTPPVVGAQLATGQNLLTELVAAAREQAPVKFRYRTVGREEITVRRVRPWAVLMAHQQWYMTGWDLDRRSQRLFKLSRIESKTISLLASEVLGDQEHASARPADFDVEDIRQRLYTDQPPVDGYVWLATDTASSVRIRAQQVDQRPGWDLSRIIYREPLKTAATIAALTTNAQVDHDRSPELAELVSDILAIVRDAHHGESALSVPTLTKVARPRKRTGDREVIARRLGIVAVVNQHGGSLARAAVRQRFGISEATLTEDLAAMQFWGMPETDFAGGQFEVDPHADPIVISNAELLAQPWQLSAPEALGLISGLSAVTTIPGISATQQAAARSLERKLRDAVDTVAPHVGSHDAIVHPDLSLGDDDEVAEVLHQAARGHLVVNISYYSESSGAISTRAIEPLQLLYSAGHAYIRAWCRKTDDYRTFRIDRIGSATLTTESFVPVKEQSDSRTIAPAVNDDAITVVVHATHRQRDVLGAYHPSATAVANDGSVFARLAFRSLTPLVELLTNHPGQITVVQPGKIRETVWTITDQASSASHESTRGLF